MFERESQTSNNNIFQMILHQDKVNNWKKIPLYKHYQKDGYDNMSYGNNKELKHKSNKISAKYFCNIM